MIPRDQHADLLVVGGGVLGTFHAYHALQHGRKVILLERSGAPQAATVRNFGQVVPSGMDLHWQQFGRESLRIYEAIQSQFDISVRRQGSLYIASDEEELTLIEELQAINAEVGYASQLWTAGQCCDRYPQLRTAYCRGGLFFAEEVSVNPRMMIHRLHRFLSAKDNYRAHFHCCVRDLSSSNDHKVVATTTDGSEYSAEKVVLCCGSEFQQLFPDLFATSDMQAVKLQMLRLKPQPHVVIPGNVLTGRSIRRYESFSQCPSWDSVKADEPGDSLADQWGVHILFKQELDGSIILGDSHEYAPVRQVDRLGFDLRSEINDYLIAEGQKIFNLPTWDIEAAWYGMYCQTQHASGIFTKTVDRNVHIATGIGGKGMTSSAGFAKHHLSEIYND